MVDRLARRVGFLGNCPKKKVSKGKQLTFVGFSTLGVRLPSKPNVINFRGSSCIWGSVGIQEERLFNKMQKAQMAEQAESSSSLEGCSMLVFTIVGMFLGIQVFGSLQSIFCSGL